MFAPAVRGPTAVLVGLTAVLVRRLFDRRRGGLAVLTVLVPPRINPAAPPPSSPTVIAAAALVRILSIFVLLARRPRAQRLSTRQPSTSRFQPSCGEGEGSVRAAPSAGSVNPTMAPPSGRLRASTEPPWRSTTSATIARPSPDPGRLLEDDAGEAIEHVRQVGCSEARSVVPDPPPLSLATSHLHGTAVVELQRLRSCSRRRVRVRAADRVRPSRRTGRPPRGRVRVAARAATRSTSGPSSTHSRTSSSSW